MCDTSSRRWKVRCHPSLIPSHRTAPHCIASHRMAPHEQVREVRAGSTAKATATSAGRGHIRGTGRPGVNSSHPAVLKSPSICMSTTRPHSIAGTHPSPFLLGPHPTTDARSARVGQASWSDGWTSAGYAVSLGKLPRQHFLTARTTSTIFLRFLAWASTGARPNPCHQQRLGF